MWSAHSVTLLVSRCQTELSCHTLGVPASSDSSALNAGAWHEFTEDQTTWRSFLLTCPISSSLSLMFQCFTSCSRLILLSQTAQVCSTRKLVVLLLFPATRPNTRRAQQFTNEADALQPNYWIARLFCPQTDTHARAWLIICHWCIGLFHYAFPPIRLRSGKIIFIIMEKGFARTYM